MRSGYPLIARSFLPFLLVLFLLPTTPVYGQTTSVTSTARLGMVSNNTSTSGYGGHFTGQYMGSYGRASGGSDSYRYGVYGYAHNGTGVCRMSAKSVVV